jgi:hypothetical protein
VTIPVKTERSLYRERAHLVAYLSALYPSVLTYDAAEGARPVLYVATGEGQMSWHIDLQDVDLFEHVPVVNPRDPRAQWDTHNRGTKYGRLQRLTQAAAAEQLDLTGLYMQVDADRWEDKAALFDTTPDRAIYRYLLERHWDPFLPTALWIMLNPSTATAMDDDATIRRVRSYSQAAGAGAFQVLNLFALRAKDPAALAAHPDPVGEDNDQLIAWFARHHRGPVIVAWGAHGKHVPDRVDRVLNLLGDLPLQCLGLTQDGHPRHPGRLAADVGLQPYPPTVVIPAARAPHEHITTVTTTVVGGTDG